MTGVVRNVCMALVWLVLTGPLVRAEDILDSQRPVFETDLSGAYCVAGAGVKVVDTSAPVDGPFLTRMASFGVEVVARYYNYSASALPPGTTLAQWQAASPSPRDVQNRKLITADEVALLKHHGMFSLAVFQYESDRATTFANWRVRAPADAQRAVDLARTLGQPRDSTIYFGVDGDFVHHYDRPCGDPDAVKPNRCTEEITRYFEVVSRQVRAAGYAVGVYGSGAACKMLTDVNFVSSCWLNASTGHSNRAFGETSDFTVLRQLLDVQKYIQPKPTAPDRSRFDSQASFDAAKAGYDAQLDRHMRSLAQRDAALARCGRDLDFNVVRAPQFGQFVYD